MNARPRFALNRIVSPALPLDRFFELARRLDISGVELRNDLPGGQVLDGLPPARVRDLAAAGGVEIVSINAVQRFNLASGLAASAKTLGDLARLGGEVGCRGIVLVPVNDRADHRSPEEIFRETVLALRALAPELERSGMVGLVEPLGFPECSLRSKIEAARAIRESGARCYKIVWDTFHHAIGPDSLETTAKGLEVSDIGLVHLSGVEAGEPEGGYRDGDRVLVTGRDRIDNPGQLRLLDSLGYRGFCSFEPFSEAVQALSFSDLEVSIQGSIDYLAD